MAGTRSHKTKRQARRLPNSFQAGVLIWLRYGRTFVPFKISPREFGQLGIMARYGWIAWTRETPNKIEILDRGSLVLDRVLANFPAIRDKVKDLIERFEKQKQEQQDAIPAIASELDPWSGGLIVGKSDKSPISFSDRRCSLCGSLRLTSGVCSFVECKDPMHDQRLEEGSAR